MVYIPRITFKSGINPSRIAWFPTNGKYSGTQKLMLTRTRIFGDKISGNFPSGMKVWRQLMPARFQYLAKSTIQMHDIHKDIPQMKDNQQTTRFNFQKLKHQQKVFMSIWIETGKIGKESCQVSQEKEMIINTFNKPSKLIFIIQTQNLLENIMKPIRRGHFKQKIINCESLTQPYQSTNYRTNIQIQGKKFNNIHSEQCFYSNQNKKATSVINKLITQNSDLKKKIYQLEHEISLIKLSFQSKQFKYKNTIKGYKKMIDSMLNHMGYEPVQSFQQNYQIISNNSFNSYQSRRQNLYARYLQDNQVGIEQNISSFSRNQNLQSKSHSIQLQQHDENPEENNQQFKKPFILDPTNYLNLNFRTLQNYEDKFQCRDNFPSLSSVTQVITPNLRVDCEQINQGLKLSLKTGKQKLKAQTQRLIKNQNKQKQMKEGGRISSQGIYSTQSFKKIVQKGTKNRQRINQLLKNKSNQNK